MNLEPVIVIDSMKVNIAVWTEELVFRIRKMKVFVNNLLVRSNFGSFDNQRVMNALRNGQLPQLTALDQVACLRAIDTSVRI